MTATAQLRRAQIIIRRVDICEACGAENSFRKSGGARRFSGIRQWYARCKKCGHKAHIRA
jgi:DNA-directed RNA polymerase subunit RPC12/RpoP